MIVKSFDNKITFDLKMYFFTITLFYSFIFILITSGVLLFGLCMDEPASVAFYTGVDASLRVGWIPVAFLVPLFLINDILGSRLDGIALSKDRSFRLKADINTAYERCIDSLRELDHPVVAIDGNKTTGEISARTAMTWKSWGEYVRFKLTVVARSMVEVRVVSRSWLFTTTRDGGVNAKNIEAVARALTQYEHA